MKNKSKADREVTADDRFDNELSSADYGFIMDTDGNLKVVFMPSDMYEKIPDVIQKVFQLFGIDDPGGVQVHTIH